MINGGSDEKESKEEFKVEETSAEIITEEEEKETPSEAEEAVNEALIRTACLVISKVTVNVTKIPELAFDEDETNQLASLWKPFIPTMPPVALAVIGTVIIIGGKVALYFSLKEKKITGTEPSTKVEEKVQNA